MFSIENIRVWAMFLLTTKSDVNGIELFEAWLQYDFDDNWSARLGRQVISYDNQRIPREGVWAQ